MPNTHKPSLLLNPQVNTAPTRDSPHEHSHGDHSHSHGDAAMKKELPAAKEVKVHPSVRTGTGSSDGNNAGIYFVGTATTILEWEGVRIMTDPNFLHAGDHVHLGPGVTGTRLTNPAVDLHDLPQIDCVLLSHYHADHFDEKVEASLRRDLPIITTPHAYTHLTSKEPAGEAFTNVHSLDFFEDMFVDVESSGLNKSGRRPRVRVEGMPGKHVPSGGILEAANEFLGAVPPTNGWIIELGYGKHDNADEFESGYRIYISGDTLLVDDLKAIPEQYSHANGKPIDLMLIHLGGTTIPSPALPLLMVTMDAKMGVELVRLIQPDLTIPIHYDDYNVFLSPLEDFKKAMAEAGYGDKVVYLDRGDQFKFNVR